MYIVTEIEEVDVREWSNNNMSMKIIFMAEHSNKAVAAREVEYLTDGRVGVRRDQRVGRE